MTTDHHADLMPGAATRSPFMAWIYNQHLRPDAIGQLAAALRGDREEPNAADGLELAAYLTGRGASDAIRAVSADAWAYFQAEQYANFAVEVADYAAQWGDDPECTLELTVAELLEDLGHDAEPPPVRAARALLIDLAPWLLLSGSNVSVRVEGDLIQLRHHPDLADAIDPRYCGDIFEAAL